MSKHFMLLVNVAIAGHKGHTTHLHIHSCKIFYYTLHTETEHKRTNGGVWL